MREAERMSVVYERREAAIVAELTKVPILVC